VVAPLTLVVMVPVGAGGLAGAGRAEAVVAPNATRTADDRTTVRARPTMRLGARPVPDVSRLSLIALLHSPGCVLAS